MTKKQSSDDLQAYIKEQQAQRLEEQQASQYTDGRELLTDYPPYLLDKGLFDWGSPRNDGTRRVRDIKEGSMTNVELILENEKGLPAKPFREEFSFTLKKDQAGKISDWTDDDTTELVSWIEKNCKFAPSQRATTNAIMSFSKKHSRNLVKERLESVKWDGKPRLDTLFIDTLGVEDDPAGYARAVTRRWLVGAVKRVYEPGCKFEMVPMLTGEQGIGKSTLIRRLATPMFFNSGLRGMKDKDDKIDLLGNWIIELGELTAVKRSAIQDIKNFISDQEDKYREPYGKLSVAHPRKSVFIGTTNESEFLKDSTGNRRFFPLECSGKRIKLDPKNPAFLTDDYLLQVLAEAREAYQAGEKCYIEPADGAIYSHSIEAQKAAKIEDPFEETVLNFLNSSVTENFHELKAWQQRYIINGEQPGGVSEQQWSQRKPLGETTNKEILTVAFGYDPKDIGRTGNKDYRKIKALITGLPNWEYSQSLVIAGKRGLKGYKRRPVKQEKQD
ncbi:virulence-associated E family protein [uncultured Lactobacillus sp.]|uniref:virulence-associated E family protein n=1 Tax=uncultured Lactobacillus sp. TaxID=153152 RepID=UPI0026663FD3|nr:virulence-associated E family protein [uncultured Lactobacillus sp.]